MIMVLLMNILTGLWLHNQNYEYYTCTVHLLYVQLVTKPYTRGLPAPGCKCDCTLSFWPHLWSRCLGNASQLYANKSYLNTAWRPREVRWLFSRAICAMTLLNDFTAKPTCNTAVFTLWVYIPTQLHLSHTSAHTEPISQAQCWKWNHKFFGTLHAITARRVMQTLEVWADIKLCHVFFSSSASGLRLCNIQRRHFYCYFKEADDCRKASYGHPSLTPSTFTFYCPRAVRYMWISTSSHV